jgi:hypothetical protein
LSGRTRYSTTRALFLLGAALFLVGLALAGCGGSHNSASGACGDFAEGPASEACEDGYTYAAISKREAPSSACENYTGQDRSACESGYKAAWAKRESATTASTTESTATASYSPAASNIEVEGYSFGFEAEISLGTARRNTLGEHPGYVNVIAPVTGTASLTNETKGYTATGEGQQYPELQAIALYPAGSAICQHDPGEYGDASDGNPEDSYYAVNPFYADSGKSLCAATIASFTPPLTQACGGAGEGESLGPGESLDLNVAPDGGSEEGSGECGSDFMPGYFVLSGIPTSESHVIVNDLNEAPVAWALTSWTGEPNCSKQAMSAAEGREKELLVPVIESQPSGFQGCVYYSHNRP